ncbi:hypothetical protein CBZ_00960 [Cellulomonas biazotea]|uniref:Uncharacterized protein n=1 Tax=Cellulomonas biazotea TaxID=1709 RepID=A0A402DLP8_9CELL|nr:hypothetical protein CBZ_00960 [Cellulomonas biazotea]
MRTDATFQGSMYSSTRCSAGRLQANAVTALSASAATPLPRARGATPYPAVARPSATSFTHSPTCPTARSSAAAATQKEYPVPVRSRSCWRSIHSTACCSVAWATSVPTRGT